MIAKKEYKNNWEKVRDFCISFFGMFIINYIISFIFALILIIPPPQSTLSYSLSVISGSITHILYIGLIIFFFKRRKYIAIGVLTSFIIYLLSGFFLGLMFRGM